jgi:urease gamma subunit
MTNGAWRRVATTTTPARVAVRQTRNDRSMKTKMRDASEAIAATVVRSRREGRTCRKTFGEGESARERKVICGKVRYEKVLSLTGVARWCDS